MIRVIPADRTITRSGKHAMPPPPTLRRAIAAGLAALALVAATRITEGYAAASQIEPSASLHQILSDDERTILLGRKHSEVLYGIIDNPLIRWRQLTKTGKYERHAPSGDEDLQLKMPSMGEHFHLTLKKNHRLSNFKDPSKMNKLVNISQDCFYHGRSLNHPNSTAALSLCDGLRGYIDTGKAVYTILPLPDHITEKLKMNPKRKPHLVVKREAPTDTFCPHALRKKNLQRRNQSPREPRTPTPADWTMEKWPKSEEKDPSRSRRSVSASAIIETAVFIDQALYDQMRTTFPTDTDRQLTTFVLTMMNAVQRLFQHSSLGKSPDVRLVLMETLKTQPQELKPSDNIDTYLTNFCIWQHNKRHYGRGKNPRWDHALLLSGINMYVVDESGRRKRHVVGLAPVSGMCNPLNSCTISEGTSFQTVLVAAHEMGHSLGMEHDGIQDGNNCDSDSFVMSPTLGTGKTTWSSCSRQYLEKFLRSQQSNCLQTTSAYATDLLDPPPENPPGQVYDADYQCTLRYGEGSRRSVLQNTEEICRMLRCETGYGSKGVSFAAHPALEGTNCGRDRWCHGGACLPIQRPSGTTRGRVIDGSWSAWSPYSPCSSDCVSRGSSAAVGIMVSTRRCDSPRPINGGRFCVGKERRVLTCDATRICAISTRKLMLDEFISDTCRQASARDTTLENTGTQFPSQENSHSCYVWCHKRGGGYMTQGWTIPDGTPCWRGYSHQNMYCVKGECQRFDCNGYSTDESNDLRCSSSTSGSSALSPGPQPPVAEVGWSPWHKISQCRPSCIVGGRGFQLVTRECNSVSGCPGQRESYQLCDTPISQNCPLAKTVDQYAVEICQRYRVKYPTVLSGKGRQLPPQPGNPHSACIVACQDRVWQDTHYQMDVYEDGKFPFGTECSLDSRTKAYCINGRCQKFSEEGLPVSTETAHMYEVRRFLSHIQRRDTSGANHVVNTINNSHVVSFKKWMAKLGPLEVPKGVATKKNTPLPEWIAKLEYGWVVEMSECSVACGGGMKNISAICQTGSTIVDDRFCSGMNKPDQTGLWPCNTHPCPGRWQKGPWSPCPVTCGEGNRTRDVICLQQLSQNVFSIVHESLCPEPFPVKSEICLEVICDENNNYVK